MVGHQGKRLFGQVAQGFLGFLQQGNELPAADG